MASITRSTLLRSLCNASGATRSFTTISQRSANAWQSPRLLARAPLKSRFIQNTLPSAPRVAAFHVTGRRQILPPLPQTVEGTTNDPTAVPDPAPAHGSYHWSMERLVAASLIPLTVLPFAAGSLNPVTDGIFGALLVAHSHIGFQSCIVDYFPSKRVPVMRRTLLWTLNVATVLVLIGLYEFETNDVGITEAVKRVWKA